MTNSTKNNHQAVMIDNATLRGALIALGLLDSQRSKPDEPIKVFDVYVASAEVLIESLLLYDHLYVPKIHDDYPETVARIQPLIGRELIQELPFTPSEVTTIEQFAERDFAAWPLADDQLRHRLQEFVGVQASALGWQGKKSNWDEVITGSYVVSNAALYTWHEYVSTASDYAISQLDTVLNQGQKQALEQFFRAPYLHGKMLDLQLLDAAILWLTYRTCVYDCLSWVAGIPYVPHPHRAALWKAINLRRSQPAIFAQVPFDVLFDARMAVAEQVKQALEWQVYDLEIPPFFTYILSKSSTASEVLDTVMQMREQGDVKALRKVLGELSANLYEKDSVAKLLKLKKQFENIKQELISQYQDPSSPKVSPSIQLAGIVGVQFDLPLPASLVRLRSRLRSLNKPHLAVLRDIFKVTTNIWQLSDLYDRLYQGRQILVEKPINSLTEISQAKQQALSQKRYDGTLVKPIFHGVIEDPHFISPLQCREILTKNLLDTPHQLCQLALIDIDGMNLYNAHSHWLGDIILNAVGVHIRKFGVDLLSRVGGDTFVAVRFKESSTAWLDTLREELSYLPIDDWLLEVWFKGGLQSHPTVSLKPITISVGLALSSQDGNSPDTLFKIAYERLTLEKQYKGELDLNRGNTPQLGEGDQSVGNSLTIGSPEPSMYVKKSSLVERVANLKPGNFSLALEQANAYQERKQYQQAIEAYTLAIALSPIYPSPSAIYQERGWAYFRNQDYKRAIADFSHAIFLDPLNATLYANRGGAYLWIKEARRASADYQRSYELNPEALSRAWMAEWAAMCHGPLTVEAVSRLERIATIAPQNYVALVCQGVALGLRGKPHQGLIELEQALSRGPEEYDVYFWQGMLRAYAYPKRPEQAVKAIERALTLRMPPILLTPLYWLQISSPKCFERCRRLFAVLDDLDDSVSSVMRPMNAAMLSILPSKTVSAVSGPVLADTHITTDKLQLTIEALTVNPRISDKDLAVYLGLKKPASARYWRLKALALLKYGR